MPLIIFGLVLSVPLIVFGATLIITLLQRFPILVWAGAALLGWIAGTLIVEDPGWMKLFADYQLLLNHVAGGVVGVAVVLGIAVVLRRRETPEEEEGAAT